MATDPRTAAPEGAAPPPLDVEAFRARAHELADWMADYLARVGEYRVQPDLAPGTVRLRLPPAPPLEPESMDAILADFQRLVLPAMTHWNHPGFFGFFPANTSPPSILAEMLTATLGAQCMSWSTSPAATELEQVTMEWLARMLDLPAGFTGVIQDTASAATLVALITARDRLTRGEPPRRVEEMTVYTSPEANSSVPKGARLAGFLPERIRFVETDESYAMRPDTLEEMITDDRAAGLVPAAVVATVGTTSSAAVDPVRSIGEVCARQGIWLHVDAAFAGSAAILPEMRWILDGIACADSFVFNPHKWLLVNFDCSAYFVRDVPALLRSFSATAHYLRAAHPGEVPDYRDWGIPLGRRFRALKLWFVLRSYGVSGLQAMVREHIRLAERFAAWVDQSPDFERLAPAMFGLVCFRHRPEGEREDAAALDARNERLLSALNASGKLFLTPTRLGGRYCLRLSVGHLTTTEAHVREAWALIQATARSSAPDSGVRSY
ncbi:MAG: pyridoxal phosphate-dependent decarboxylase family protein [Gemmatimonadales bacterium]